MKKNDMRRWLKKYSPEDIEFTQHAKIRCSQRRISVDLLEDNLLNPKNLIFIKEEGNPGHNKYKFKLYFKLSNARTLCIRVIINKSLKVITSYIIVNKIQKGLWLKWKK